MLHTKETEMAERLSTAFQSLLLLGMNFSADSQKEDAKFPFDNIDANLQLVLEYYIRFYRNDTDGLLKKYKEGSIWKAAIRKQLQMDDPEEAGYWYYHQYGVVPNELFAIYFSEHPSIAFEKILEMFESGLHEEYLKLNLNLRELVDRETFSWAHQSVMEIIEERLDKKQIIHQHETSRFIAYLSLYYEKDCISLVESFRNSGEQHKVEFAALCQDKIESNHPHQLSLLV